MKKVLDVQLDELKCCAGVSISGRQLLSDISKAGVCDSILRVPDDVQKRVYSELVGFYIDKPGISLACGTDVSVRAHILLNRVGSHESSYWADYKFQGGFLSLAIICYAFNEASSFAASQTCSNSRRGIRMRNISSLI
jgi:hypothetical protein